MSLDDLRSQQPELYQALEGIAHTRTIPFCYLCYEEAPLGRCNRCYSDDLMRLLQGVGVEYGYEWVIEHLVSQEVQDIPEDQQEEIFMDFIDECYGDEISIGFLKVNTSWAVKQLDEVTFDLALKEYFADVPYIEVDGKLYSITDIEQWADEQEDELQGEEEREEAKTWNTPCPSPGLVHRRAEPPSMHRRLNPSNQEENPQETSEERRLIVQKAYIPPNPPYTSVTATFGGGV